MKAGSSIPEQLIGPLQTAAIECCLGIVQFTGSTEENDRNKQAKYFEQFFRIFAHYGVLPVWYEVLKTVRKDVADPEDNWYRPASMIEPRSSTTSPYTKSSAILVTWMGSVDVVHRVEQALGERDHWSCASASRNPSPNSDLFCLSDDEVDGSKVVKKHDEGWCSSESVACLRSALESL
jgi:hypothetical protein